MSAQTPETFGFQAEISQLLVSWLLPFCRGWGLDAAGPVQGLADQASMSSVATIPELTLWPTCVAHSLCPADYLDRICEYPA